MARGRRSPVLDESRLSAVLRAAILGVLVAAPLALGAVHEPAFVPLLAIAFTVGILSWARGHWLRAQGVVVAAVPGHRLLIALHALVVLQLVPLPVALLRVVSPGSFLFYAEPLLVPLAGFRPISVNPADTARGLCFLAGLSLLYGAVFREFSRRVFQRRLARTIIGTALVMTIAALVQAASPEPTRIYGLWKPAWDWGVFGPYVSRNHFAGYLAMAIPLAFGFAAEALSGLAEDWRRTRPRWVALGGPSGNQALRLAAITLTLLVGLLASQSRGGLMGMALALLTLVALWRRGRVPLLIIGAFVVFLALAFVDLSAIRQGFASRGIYASRVVLWQDALPIARDFPVFGSGLDTFGTSYIRYQTLSKYHWYGEVHNEYLQVLLDLGLVGAGLVGALLVRLLGAGLRASRAGAMGAGLFGGLLACCFHNLVEFNWQIPANAATFAALTGLVMSAREAEPDPDALTPAADGS